MATWVFLATDNASITTFAVHARDINATALPTDDKTMGLTSIERVSYLFELKRWFQGPKLCVNQGKQSSCARPGQRLDHHLCGARA